MSYQASHFRKPHLGIVDPGSTDFGRGTPWVKQLLFWLFLRLMKLEIAGLTASDVLRMSEAEARERGLVEPGREFIKDHYWWTKRLDLLNRYTKFYPMDELPSEYKVTESNPKPPVLTYGIPIHAAKISTYWNKNEPDGVYMKKPLPGMFGMHTLSKHVQYPLRLGFPATLATEYSLVVVLYTNYDIDRMQLIQEDEEDVIAMVKEALELDQDVRPRWDFDSRDPFVPKLDQD